MTFGQNTSFGTAFACKTCETLFRFVMSFFNNNYPPRYYTLCMQVSDACSSSSSDFSSS